MKRTFISIILIALAAPCSAQWNQAYMRDHVLAFGVHDSSLYIGIDPPTLIAPLIWRLVSIAPNVVWQKADTGISRSQGLVTSFASLGKYFFANIPQTPGYVSTNDGSKWTQMNVAAPVASNGRYLFAKYGLPDQIIRSTDSGNSWEVMTNLGVSSYSAIGIAIFANTGSAIWRSLDTGGHWNQLTAPFTGSMTVMDSLLFVVGGNGKLAESTDLGTGWTTVPVDSAGVPMSVNCLATNGKYLFAGTPGGILYSADKGVHWKAVNNDGIPPGYYDVLTMCAYDTLLFIDVTGSGSYVLYSRSIPQITDTTQSQVQQLPLKDTLEIYPNPSTGMVTIVNGAPIFRIAVTNLLGTEVLSILKLNESSTTLDLSKEPAGTYFISVQTANGNAVRKIIKEK